MTAAKAGVRYELVHRTEYTYDDEVSASYGRAHLIPRDLPDQQCFAGDVTVSPEPAELREHVDFFGNRSTYFLVDAAHRELTVTASSTVLVDRSAPAPAALNQRWEDVAGTLEPSAEERAYLLPSPLVDLAPAVAAYARPSFDAGRPLGEALVDLLARISADFAYKPGTTTVRTTLPEVLRKRTGVCQDFAHLAIGCLRSLGLATRYVSGYLETTPPPGRPKLLGADASHAWASVFVPGRGWVDIDPTNDQFVDSSYVVAGWGRDYDDVPPLKGVIFTDAKTSTMRVSVDLARTS